MDRIHLTPLFAIRKMTAGAVAFVFFISFLFSCIAGVPSITTNMTVKVGLMLPHMNQQLKQLIGFGTSAGAVTVALEQIENDHLLDHVNWEFKWLWPECSETLALRSAVQLIGVQRVDVIIGPPCSIAAIVTGVLAFYHNVPVISWAATGTALNDRTRFPTFARTVPSTKALGKALLTILHQFDWRKFALLYSDNVNRRKCFFFQEGFRTLLEKEEESEYEMEFLMRLRNATVTNESELDGFLKKVSNKARVIISCLDRAIDQRLLMLRAEALGMDSDEYVYILPDNTPLSNVTLPWLGHNGDGKDALARKAFEKVLLIHWKQIDSEELHQFKLDIMQKIKKWPFFHDPLPGEQYGSSYSPYMHDAMYLYAKALNKSLDAGHNKSDGRRIIENAMTISFQGKSGSVVLDNDGSRTPPFVMKSMDETGDFKTYAEIHLTLPPGQRLQWIMSERALWYPKGKNRPPAVPKCGFYNEKCGQKDNNNGINSTVVGVMVASVMLLILALSALFAAFAKARLLNNAEHEMLWRVYYRDLASLEKSAQSHSTLESHESSDASTTSVGNLTVVGDYTTFYCKGNLVLCRKYEINGFSARKADYVQFYKMREITHDTLNRFIGMCLDGPVIMSVWNFCAKGSLQDIFKKEGLVLDWYFKYSLTRDLVEGLVYLHASFLNFHGHLKSNNCLIDGRWTLKISDYGMNHVNAWRKIDADDQLWTAPELLRNELKGAYGSAEGDIYSLAIIISEVVMRQPAYTLNDISNEEIVYRVRKGENIPYRPLVELSEEYNNVDVNSAMIRMMRDCWEEEPSQRPGLQVIKSQLNGMVKGKGRSLTDYVLSMMEKYAGSLEKVVEERTMQLNEEKKKADILLYRLLPMSVADKLKAGVHIDPEHFDSVTILFSDVVGFTSLSNRLTPLQVVWLLNELYTLFDGIIDEHDVYKVETIGDGYMCVSGLPHRNEMRHATECADMSISLMRATRGFKIPHLPRDKLRLRIGIHTGSCVAGVVGLAMPRYCLFGDSVTTAARMESQGKPGCIQITNVTNELLSELPEGYMTRFRGEVLIKGKGVVETYWLLGKGEAEPFLSELLESD